MPWTALNPMPKVERPRPSALPRGVVPRIALEADLIRRKLARWGLDKPIGRTPRRDDAAA